MNIAHRRIIVALCSALLVGGSMPTTAWSDTSADLKDQLSQAQTELDGLYANAETASNELNKTVDDLAATEADIEETSAQIEVKQSELGIAQKTLEHTVAESYKDGPVSLLSIVLSSTSFEDFVSRIYYANKVSESYSQQIQTVKTIQSDLAQKRSALEEQHSSLEQLRVAQEEQKNQLTTKAREVETYVAGLSAELQEALAAEAAARAEEARAKAAAALEAAGGSVDAGAADASSASNGGQGQQSQQAPQEGRQNAPKDDEKKESEENRPEAPSSESQEQEKEKETEQPQETREQQQEQPQEQREPQEPEDQESDSPQEDSEPSTPEDSSSSEEPAQGGDRAAVVNYVLAQVGKPYVWATHGPDSFDCSGLTGAAYESIGIFVGYSDSYQVQFCNKPASEAVYGDIVWRPGHVGLCIGGGVTVEAFNPSMGVGYGSVDSFELSGSPLP